MKRLSFPSRLIDRNVTLLQRDLRRVYRKFQRHELNHNQALSDGEILIRQSFDKAEQDIKDFMHNHGLLYNGDHTELDATLTTVLARWRRIVGTF